MRHEARSKDEIERAAVAGGMRSLWDDGLDKVADGITSVEELARVVSDAAASLTVGEPPAANHPNGASPPVSDESILARANPCPH